MSLKQRFDEFISAPLVQAYLQRFPESQGDLEVGFFNGYQAGLADAPGLAETQRSLSEATDQMKKAQP